MVLKQGGTLNKKDGIFGISGIRAYQQELTWVSRLVDIACIYIVMFFVVEVHDAEWHRGHSILITLAMTFYLLIAEHIGVYRSWRINPIREEIGTIFLTWVIVITLLLLLGYVTKTTQMYSRLEIGFWGLGVLVLLTIWRGILRFTLRICRVQGHNTRSVAFAGISESTDDIVDTIKNSTWMGLNIIGFYDDRRSSRDSDNKDVEYTFSGSLKDLVNIAKNGEVDVIYITLPLSATARLKELVVELSDTTASVYIVPDSFVAQVYNGYWVRMGEIQVINIFESPFYGIYGWVKRLEDIFLSVIILPLIIPVMLIIAIVIKVTSDGPVIFKQRRYGLDGSCFKLFKFRTMMVTEDGDTIIQAKKNDSRLTSVGAFLRKHSLDELPQFFNVLSGNMSVVGPRPHAVAHNKYYRSLIEGYMLRHKMKPGITGWAQINGWRGETETMHMMEKRIEHDLWYMRNWSLLLDIKVVILTALVGFRSKGIH